MTAFAKQIEGLIVASMRPICQRIQELKSDMDRLSGAVPSLDAIVAAVTLQIKIPEDGRDGRDGRDAIEIEIDPQIDESKSVPRGTYAMHRGGLWRSGERTKGMRGWDCVVNGIHSIEVYQADDGRTFQLNCELSNGDCNEYQFRLNHCIDRGVFADGKSYLTGDGVTHLGSYWIAKQDLPQRNPGQDQDEWRLAVRKGRDAKK